MILTVFFFLAAPETTTTIKPVRDRQCLDNNAIITGSCLGHLDWLDKLPFQMWTSALATGRDPAALEARNQPNIDHSGFFLLPANLDSF